MTDAKIRHSMVHTVISTMAASLMHLPAIEFFDDARWFGYVQLRFVNGRSTKAVTDLFSIPVY